eukprot:m.84665 g.84665  ORF g.84665 m.84665 type:complete len:962 (+) comp15031_c0_seq2:203-3088(+)
MASTGNVRVVVRVRPQMENELLAGGTNVAFFDGTGKNITINGQRKAAFTFDRAFGPDSTQDEVYNYAAKPIVEDVLKGYNGTIFAYGQTSSGKTHTMEGPDIDGPDRGIIPRIVQNIFQYIDIAPETLEFTVRVSYFEIYMERIRDLLCDGNDNLQIHENRERGVYVRHATELFMQGPEEVMDVMRSGAERRSVASTQMNDISSRSHSVFLMEITQRDTIKGGVKTGKLYLVDLAGSEKVSKTGADGEVLEEAKNINKSLSALGLVIMSLTDGQARQHVPYRDSKLTRILQESLGGNARTTIIICASPSSYNEQETFSSLRFGQRAKKIKNNAVVNQQYSAEELQKQLDAAKKEIKLLTKKVLAYEAELQIWRSGGTVSEADRAAFSNSSAEKLESGERVGSDGDGPGPASSGMSDEERSEMMRRETELLDLLDDKEEHIHQLEREVELLSQDKVTFTKLASENASQRAKIKDLEDRIDEVLAENTEYEVNIEDLARMNNEQEEALNMAITDKERLEQELKGQGDKVQTLVQSVSEMLQTLTSGKASGSKTMLLPPAETGTPLDAHIAKARSYVASLQTDLSAAKKAKEDGDEAAKRTTAEKDDLALQLDAAKKTVQRQEQNIQESNEQIRSLEQTIKDMRVKNEALTDLMDEKLKSKKEAESEEIKQAFERQKEAQREQHAQLLDELHGRVDKLKKENQDVVFERDQLQLEVNRLKADLDKKASAVTSQSDKMEKMEQRLEQLERNEKEAQRDVEETRQQLASYVDLKRRMQDSILNRIKGTLGADKSAVLNEQQSKHIEYLEKTIKELNQQKTDFAKSNAALQRDVMLLEKKQATNAERVKNLEQLMKDSEKRLLKEYEDHERRTHDPDRVRGAQRQAQAKVVRRKMSTKAPNQAPVVQRGNRESADATKAEFWESQGQQGGAAASPASQRSTAVTSRGGGSPTPAPASQSNPLTVEFV